MEKILRIEKIHLIGVGVFKDTTIEFSKEHNIHIFTGENGTGKTTLLHSLASGFKDNINTNTKKLRKSFISHYRDKSFLELNYTDLNSVKVLKEQDSLIRLGNKKSKVFEYLQKQESFKENRFDFSVFAYSGNRSLSSTGIQKSVDITNSPFYNILDFDYSVNNKIFSQWLIATYTKKTWASTKGAKGDIYKFSQKIENIQNLIFEITNLQVKFIFDYSDDGFEIFLEVNNRKLDFDVLPDGLKSIISWIADLLMRMDRIPWIDNRDIFDREFILFLDEIDIHLHPSWQRKILIVVQKLFKNAQIFISTHSPFVVGSISGAKVYILDKNGNVKIEDSKAGYRYFFVADKVFGIDDEFDIETEKELVKFAELRDIIYKLENFESFDKKQEFLDLVERVSSKSVSLSNLVGREIRQLEKVTGFQIV